MMKIAIAILLGLAVAGLIGWAVLRAATPRAHRSQASFSMPIDDVFALKAKGKVVVVGVISKGDVFPLDRLTILSGGNTFPVQVEALEAFHKPLASAKAGDRVGIMLRGVDKEDISLPATLTGKK